MGQRCSRTFTTVRSQTRMFQQTPNPCPTSYIEYLDPNGYSTSNYFSATICRDGINSRKTSCDRWTGIRISHLLHALECKAGSFESI